MTDASVSDSPRDHAVKPRPKHSKGRKISPLLALVSVPIIYFAAQILTINLIAAYQLSQGLSINEVETWLRTGLVGPFTSSLTVATVGIFLVYLLLRLLRISWTYIGLIRPKSGDLFSALLGYGWYLLLYFGVALVVGVALPFIDFDQQQQLGFSTDIAGSALALVFVSLVIVPPLYEEVLTRGLLFTGLRGRLSFPVAAIITSLLFGAAHLQWGSGAPLLWVAAIDTFVLSLVLVYLRERTGSLWPCIGLHAIKNLVAFTLLFVFKVV